MTDAAEEREESAGREPPWARTVFAAGLTAMFTVLVALSAFFSAAAASDSDDNFAAANLALTDANFFFEQGVDALIEELAAEGIEIDRVCVLAVVSPAAEGLCDDTSALDELTADDPVFATGFEAQASADDAFALGLRKSKESVDYQAALVLFAVGLALSAWASLSDMAVRPRFMFVSTALSALVAGLVRLLTV